MKTKLVIYIVTVLFLLANTFSLTDYTQADSLQIELTNSIEFGVQFDSNSYRVSSFEVISYFTPENSPQVQQITSTQTSIPFTKDVNEEGRESYNFNFDSQTLDTNNLIESKFVLNSYTHQPKVRSKSPFPIPEIDPEFEKYTQFSGFIDTSPQIRTQASSLAQGEDDVFVIATKIADWIEKDINYDLSTITENPNQASSQVFISKDGVCREIANLFVSMMRSLDIPARVVSGYAFTTSPEVVDFVGDNWGGHAWAEVLIDGEWVPFDLTYRQYGYVDPTHIILYRGQNLDERSVLINATGNGFSLTPNTLDSSTEFNVLNYETGREDNINVEIRGPELLDPLSYGFLELEIENLDDFYKVLSIGVYAPSEIEFFEESTAVEVLRPDETKSVIIPYKISDLDPGFIYTLPFSVNINNEKYEYYVESSHNSGNNLLKSELPSTQRKTTTLTNEQVEVSCDLKPATDSNEVSCNVKNPNNFVVTDFELCVRENCQSSSLLINEEKEFTYSIDENVFQTQFTYTQNSQTYTGEVSYTQPEIVIFSYDINFQELNFNVGVNYLPRQAKVLVMEGENVLEEFESERIQQAFTITPGTQTVTISVVSGDRVLASESITVTSKKKTLWDRIVLFFQSLF